MYVCIRIKHYTSISISIYLPPHQVLENIHIQLFSLGDTIMDHVCFLLYGSLCYLKL